VKPAIYHCIGRVCQRQFLLDAGCKEKFRIFMRMYEGFSGCRVLSYCIMDNHVHVLLEVPPLPEAGLTDEELLNRLRCLYSADVVKLIGDDLAAAREKNMTAFATEIHARHTYRMHDLSQFMKSLMGRFAQWYNRTHQRKGVFWEDRFKSVIVENGYASRMMAAYIDLNPVRAGIVTDPADYRWSSYGEAMGGKHKARAGLVRAYMAHKGWQGTSKQWGEGISRDYRRLLLIGGKEVTTVRLTKDDLAKGKARSSDGKNVRRKGRDQATASAELAVLQSSETQVDARLSQAIQHRVRYFIDGAVIGSRAYVNEVFEKCRERFGERRTSGARKMRGGAAPAAEMIWSVRDLRVDVTDSLT
jgi:putative transposase